MPNAFTLLAREEITRHSELFKQLQGARNPKRIEEVLSVPAPSGKVSLT